MKNYRLFKRAFTDLFSIGKKYYVLFSIQSLANQSMPFVGFIYVTRIVHALTIDQLSVIPNLILQFLGSLFVLQVIAGVVQPLVNDEGSILVRQLFSEPHKKMLTMQFQYAESSEVREQLEVINRSNMNNASSLPMLKLRVDELVPRFITIVWGLVLLVPLYSVNMEQLPEQYWWLHPFMILTVFFVLIAVSVRIQIKTSKKTGSNLQEMFAELQKSNALFFYEDEILHDVKSGKEIRLYDLTQRMIENTKADTQFTGKLLSENYKQFRQLVLPASGLFQVMNYFVYAYIGLLVLVGALPVALIIQLSSALSQMVSALPDFIQHGMMMLSSPEGLQQYYDFMDLPDEEVIGSLPVEKRLDNDYRIQTDHLSFAYPGSNELVLKDITESFEVGKKYAIVGENGSGKTTFIKLLTRLYAPTEGSIKVNKIDVKKYDLKEYFNLFGVVFQDYHLLGFSLGQNVSVHPTFNKEKVMDKLDKVGMGEFVRHLPRQLDTYLGTEFDESGVNVSGGQEQKLALARSLYKDAPIMVLDEPTAALDPITEFEVYQNFDTLVEDKTAFYISHRLSSSKFCDEILVFDKGEIIQRGTHEDLVKEDGKYQELWTAQAQYYQ